MKRYGVKLNNGKIMWVQAEAVECRDGAFRSCVVSTRVHAVGGNGVGRQVGWGISWWQAIQPGGES